MFQDKGTTAIQLVPNVQWSLGHKFIFTSNGEVHVSVDYLLFNNGNLFIFTVKKEGVYKTQKKRKKLIGHCARLRENDDYNYLTHEPSRKEKAATFLMCCRWYAR